MAIFTNPFRPGAGHMPPYLAGRQAEQKEFQRLLKQKTILDNLVLTGLRGVGKTVLLETLKPTAIKEGWMWVGTDRTEATSVSEANLATRIITDLSVITSGITLTAEGPNAAGFTGKAAQIVRPINYSFLIGKYEETPGLVVDKIKAVLEFVWSIFSQTDRNGIVFAYDEAQNLSDNAEKEQYPLAVLLDVFQSIQRKGIPFMLVLVGLPTLFPKLVESRTYSERMFRVLSLSQLDSDDCEEAIKKPVQAANCPIHFSQTSVEIIAGLSGGYPYFIQFICREVYDIWVQQAITGTQLSVVPQEEITRKLDTDFFAGRWARVTDRQRELMFVVANLDNCDAEFSVQDIVDESSTVLEKGFGNSHANQILATLTNQGLIYKNRHGKYSFAVPLMASFIKRQYA
jgi:Cdc6-like AAA superfamily ATPase